MEREWLTCTIELWGYFHAPLGVTAFLFSVQNVWEMTTVGDKIACHPCMRVLQPSF